MSDNYIFQNKANINPMKLNSMVSFSNVNGYFSGNRKDVYFLRYIGIDTKEKYKTEIIKIHNFLCSRSDIKYLKIQNLEVFQNIDEIKKIITKLEQIEILDKDGNFKWDSFVGLLEYKKNISDILLKECCIEIIEIYRKITKNYTVTMVKNFIIKVLNWINSIFPKIFEINNEIKHVPKIIYCGKIKNQEYLFLYLLARIGCDILYLNPERDAEISLEISKTSDVYEEKNKCSCDIFKEIDDSIIECQRQEIEKRETERRETQRREIERREIERREIERRELERKEEEKRTQGNKTINRETDSNKAKISVEKEKTYEELATLASSVVMISNYDRNKKCIKTGSGVVISDMGYILTNFHVISKGYYYGVQIENESEMYFTDEIVKYNNLEDLAIIKIKYYKRKIPVYNPNNELVRGQKVVAIGSPLGLFNSVSNGIISGFRTLNDISMIQFTAPVSPGSSGGALLNLEGQLIGIITAGYDDGQNINLAVDYKTVYKFANNFL
jgi:S1-C subfamily serine protease